MIETLEAIKFVEWLTIVAIVLGPVAAVQAQKWLERQKEHRSRQLYIFRILMATRATRLAPDHVTALNMIDMDFSEKRKKEKPVVRAWRVLLDQFGKYPNSKDYQNQSEYLSVFLTASTKADEYFVDLLFEMSKCLGYDFEKIHIRNGCYAPTGHAEQENDQRLVRKGLIGMFEGKIPMSMNVVSLPEQAPHEESIKVLQAFAARQEECLELLKKVIKDDGHISVTVSDKKVPANQDLAKVV